MYYISYLHYRKPCRVKYKFTASGEKVRVSRRTGTVIPKSPELRERRDFKSRAGYVGERGTHVYHFVCRLCVKLNSALCLLYFTLSMHGLSLQRAHLIQRQRMWSK